MWDWVKYICVFNKFSDILLTGSQCIKLDTRLDESINMMTVQGYLFYK
jgi:hypothetical protein